LRACGQFPFTFGSVVLVLVFGPRSNAQAQTTAHGLHDYFKGGVVMCGRLVQNNDVGLTVWGLKKKEGGRTSIRHRLGRSQGKMDCGMWPSIEIDAFFFFLMRSPLWSCELLVVVVRTPRCGRANSLLACCAAIQQYIVITILKHLDNFSIFQHLFVHLFDLVNCNNTDHAPT